MLSVKTHGKLYIAGEYQVLNTGGNAILLSLDKYVYINICRADNFSYESRGISYEFVKDKCRVIFNKHHNDLVEKTFETVFAYLNSLQIPIKPFKLSIASELESETGIKYGFGSSSAVISGIIKAVTSFNNIILDNEALFKLSVLTQISLGDVSSGGDIAAAIYGGWIYYERYDYNWVIANVGKLDLVNIAWPNLIIERMDVKDTQVLAAWTKIAYKTLPLKKAISSKKHRRAYKLVLSLKAALETNNYKVINHTIKSYNNWMKNILKHTNRYTQKLAEAIKIANKNKFVAKVSGAGGGDCAIIVYNKNIGTNKLWRELEMFNIQPFIF